ncbi:IstB-like ATP-binding protein [Burkholderia lata]|nr:IstB-like ATP-binding protein [Burkholderia lata]
MKMPVAGVHIVFIGNGGSGNRISLHRSESEPYGATATVCTTSSTIERTNALALEESTGKQGQIGRTLMYVDLVILDELGYPLFSRTGGVLLFRLLVRAHERRDRHQSQLRRVGDRIQGFEDGDGAAGPGHTPLPLR